MIDDVSVRELFEAALRLPAEDRSGFVSRVPSDADRTALERLLAGDASFGMLDRPLDGELVAQALESQAGRAATANGADEHAALVGRLIGGFRVLRLLGQGGMGDVYEAEQARPRRRVALKVLRSAFHSRATARRFVLEAEILARLRHPGIAQVHEVGCHESELGSIPWFAMELVDGAEPVDRFVQARGLALRARLELFARVCEAVRHGHAHGVIHRDLKPANILVDRDGAPRVIDFGVARSADGAATLATMHTSAGELVGTLRYMSPEQCAGDPDAVDVRADVYALGVVLHEMIVGESPYDLEAAGGALALPRIVAESEPRPLRQFDRALPVDLETIVLTCLRKEPERRYQTVDELFQDVRRFLANEPIEARRDQTWYVVRKLVARHRVGAAAVAAFLVLLVASSVALTFLYGRAASDRALAEARAEALRRRDYMNAIALAANALEDDDVVNLRALLDRCPEDLRDWEWWHLRAAADDATATLSTDAVADDAPNIADRAWVPFAVRAAGDLAAIAGRDGAVHLWDLRADALVETLPALDFPVQRLTFSRDGALLAMRSAADDAGPRGAEPVQYVVWDVAKGSAVSKGAFRLHYGGQCFTPDGRWYLAGDGAFVAVVDLANGAAPTRLECGGKVVTDVAASPDGARIAAVGYDLHLRVWDVDGWRLRAAHPAGSKWLTAVAFSPDGTHLLWGDALGNVQEIEADGGRVVRVFDREPGEIVAVDWSRDGRLVLVATQDAIGVRDASNGALVARLHVGGKVGGRPVFLGDSGRIATGGTDRRLRIVGLSAPRARAVIGTGGGMVTTSRDGRWAATAQFGKMVQVWDLEAGALARTWPAHVEAAKIYGIAFDPDGERIATSASDGTIQIWRFADGASIARLRGENELFLQVSWSPDGALLCSAGRDGRICAWNATTGERIGELSPGEPPPQDEYYVRETPRTFDISPDGTLIATSGHEGDIRLWTWPGFAPVRTLAGHDALVRSLRFSPDGRLLASAGHDATFRIWEVESGAQVHRLEDRGQYGLIVRFSPDGRRLLTSANTTAFRIWDVGTGTPLLLLTGHSAPAASVDFSGDGRCVVSSGSDGDVRAWYAPGFDPRGRRSAAP